MVKKINKIGCTGNVVVIDKNNYYVANAGDSRSSVWRDNKAMDLSKDHTP